MSLALVHSRAREGVRAPAVQVEVHLSGGLPIMTIVGLPEAAVRESKDRVRAAIQNAQFEFPQRRITVNLAPADLPKDWKFERKWVRFSGNGGSVSSNLGLVRLP
jgi:magnesium chelatase family protein